MNDYLKVHEIVPKIKKRYLSSLATSCANMASNNERIMEKSRNFQMRGSPTSLNHRQRGKLQASFQLLPSIRPIRGRHSPNGQLPPAPGPTKIRARLPLRHLHTESVLSQCFNLKMSELKQQISPQAPLGNWTYHGQAPPNQGKSPSPPNPRFNLTPTLAGSPALPMILS